MRKLLVASIVAASFAWLAGSGLDAAQDEVTADTRLLASARYVALGFNAGGGFLSEFDSQKLVNVTAEDRAALVEFRKRLETWHRYVLTDNPAHAELLIGVGIGRRGSVGGSIPIGGRQPVAGARGYGVSAQVSSPDDMLTVYSSVGGRTRSLIWRKSLPKGLSDPSAPLFEQFRLAVDAASKNPRP